jgi:large subunit ribosomal protein L17
MRHGRKVKKLGRTAAHRKAMLANMATSLITHSMIKTTPVKAREVCRVVERLVTLAKRGDIHARRQAAETIRDKAALKRLFDEIGPQLASRQGGYTRRLRMGIRRGDAAPISVVQLLVETPKPEKETKGKKKKAKSETGTSKKKKTAAKTAEAKK